MSNGSHHASRKRKDRDGPGAAEAEPTPNRLLAGYLAHEFLARGTLLGQRWDPDRPEAEAEAEAEPEPRRPSQDPVAADLKPEPIEPQVYAEVACLMKDEGAHVQGVVNPSQLAQWLQRM
eukprot:TRINITY_DN4912_c1_g1_i1.p2 TRINITY_DN4912_c1_g1~~TRINITY_DN4912_c1_g1_i1.p2  ORF type:complete len:120 (+),score=13.54 TRINITY_DN4912_c1_g1_i1:438-797(+)